MIPGLEEVRTIVSHKNCPDGIASALICHHAMPEAEVLFCMYGEKSYDELPATRGMLFVDIVPPKERVQEFVDAGAIVLDHHLHAEDIVAAFGDRGRFAHEKRDAGVSGALLAFTHVWDQLSSDGDPVAVKRFAEVAGVRDTWQRDDPRWDDACAQMEVLLLHGYDGLKDEGPWLSGSQMATGRALRDRRRRIAKSAARRAHVIGRFAFTNERYVSDFAEAVRELGADVEVGVGFSYVGQDDGSMNLVFSLRTIAGDFDVGALAKRNGGGGHTKAAGFTIDDWVGQDPITIFLGEVKG